MRGNPVRYWCYPRRLRSIPACAGEPIQALQNEWVVWVYPRVCGGTEDTGIDMPATKGLSPRVRGNQADSYILGHCERSIPACAGEPYAHCGRCYGVPVYPRVCGGTGLDEKSRHELEGLSPRVRGNRRELPANVVLAGSIPACAGEPHYARNVLAGYEVYPRVCGGTCPPARTAAQRAGLSPRVRGNRHRYAHLLNCGRSIPACAGEPDLSGRPHVIDVVYPRVCGGTAPRNDPVRLQWGLSPRVRGNRGIIRPPTS